MSTPKQHTKNLLAERAARAAAGEPLGNLTYFGQRKPRLRVYVVHYARRARLNLRSWFERKVLRRELQWELPKGHHSRYAVGERAFMRKLIEENGRTEPWQRKLVDDAS